MIDLGLPGGAGLVATYWIKMLSDIEVLDKADENFWMKTAYLIPDRPFATMTPGEANVPMRPIGRMLPRSFLTNVATHSKIAVGAPVTARGIAFGSDCGVKNMHFSTDDGRSWQAAKLGEDEGKYGFRRWEAAFTLPERGAHALQVRANCAACHSAEMVHTQPPLTKAAWQAEVTKMQKVYKATLNEDDIPAIIDYLTRLKSPSS